MNEIANAFLLAGDKFMPEMIYLYDLLIVLVVHLLKAEKKFMQKGMQIIFTRMILIKLVYNMIWLMVNIKT